MNRTIKKNGLTWHNIDSIEKPREAAWREVTRVSSDKCDAKICLRQSDRCAPQRLLDSAHTIKRPV